MTALNTILFRIGFLIITFAISLGLTKYLMVYLRRKRILDIPNSRGNHETPIPRGGGIAIISSVFLGYCLIKMTDSIWAFSFNDILVAFAIVLAGVSWLDDLLDLSIKWRLLAQIIVVTICLFFVPKIFNEQVPIYLEKIGLLISWVWFINLYNFMDGIDGITGIEVLSICVPLFLLFQDMLPLIVASSTLGFLIYNWHPARIFMGDVGSISLGFLIGGLLIQATTKGNIQIALILPAYYLCDSTFTLISRILQGKKFWLPHSEHWYQKLVRSGQSHRSVVIKIILINLILIGTSYLIFKEYGNRTTLVLAGYVFVAGTMFAFKRGFIKI